MAAIMSRPQCVDYLRQLPGLRLLGPFPGKRTRQPYFRLSGNKKQNIKSWHVQSTSHWICIPFCLLWFVVVRLAIQWINVINVIRHDDVIKWKHFPRYWPFLRGIHRWPANLPHLFDLRLNKWLSKQSRDRLYETPPRSSWRHSDEIAAKHEHCA